MKASKYVPVYTEPIPLMFWKGHIPVATTHMQSSEYGLRSGFSLRGFSFFQQLLAHHPYNHCNFPHEIRTGWAEGKNA